MKIKSWLSSEWRPILFWICFVWLFYGYSLFFDYFVFDDALHLFGNDKTGVESPSDLLYFWQNSLTPVIFFFWQLIALVFGTESPAPFRAFNFFLMSGCGYLLVRIFQNFLEIKKSACSDGNNVIRCIPFLAAGFYILHPAQVESVIWTSSARTLLSTFFALISWYLYLQFDEENEETKHFGILTIVFFVLGLLSKPSIVTLPILIIGTDYLRTGKIKNAISKVWPMLLVGAVLGLLHTFDIFTPYLKSLDFKTRILICFDSLFHYFKMVFFPFNVSFDYARNPDNVALDFVKQGWMFFLKPIIVISIIFIFSLIKKLRSISIILILFYLVISPNMGLVHYDFQNISTVSNRYLNFPLIIIALGLGLLLKLLFESKEKVTVFSKTIISLCVMTLLVLNFNAGRVWKTSEEVLKDGLTKTGTTFSLSVSLGYLNLENKKYAMSEKHFLNAWRIEPYSPSVLNGLVELYQSYQDMSSIGDFIKRLEKLNITITADKAYELGNLYFMIEQYPKALQYTKISYQQGVRVEDSKRMFTIIEREIETAKLKAYLTLIKVYMNEGRLEDARPLTLKARKEFPNSDELTELTKDIFKKRESK